MIRIVGVYGVGYRKVFGNNVGPDVPILLTRCTDIEVTRCAIVDPASGEALNRLFPDVLIHNRRSHPRIAPEVEIDR